MDGREPDATSRPSSHRYPEPGLSLGCSGCGGAIDSYIGNCSNAPVEALERDYPFMAVEEYALRPGSSGAGTRRPGLGARRVYRILEDDVSFNCCSDRFRIAPWGLFGGRPGEKTRFLLEREGETIELESKVNFPLRKGDRLVIEIAGGGGYGDPRRHPVHPDRGGGVLTSSNGQIY